MIMNPITIANLLNISIHNTQIEHGFLSTMKYHSFRSHFISFQEIFVNKLAHYSCKMTIYPDGQAVYYHDSK